jgi:hypothetical protein
LQHSRAKQSKPWSDLFTSHLGAFEAPEDARGKPSSSCANAWYSMGRELSHTASWTAPASASTCAELKTAQAVGPTDPYKTAQVCLAFFVFH